MRAGAPLRMVPAAVGHGAGAVRARVGGLSATAKRRTLYVLAALVLLATLYFAWFRDSSLVEVRDVTVSGITTEDAPRIRARLMAAARAQSTLHVDKEALMRALPVGAAVADLRISTDFPHGMAIEVIQSPAVAVLVAPGKRMPVAADGALLKGVRAGDVPSIHVGALPASGRVGRGRAQELVAVASTAPRPLRKRVARIRKLPGKGLVAYLERGPQVIFGDASSLAAKWAAAAAVLADGGSRGASYVDVTLPDRPVAGGVDVPQPEPEQPPAGAAAVQPGAVPAPATGATGPTGVTPEAATPQPAPAVPVQPTPVTP